MKDAEGIVIHGAMGECGGVHLFPCRVCTQGCRKNVRVFVGSFFVQRAGTLWSGRNPMLFFSPVRSSWAKHGSKGELKAPFLFKRAY